MRSKLGSLIAVIVLQAALAACAARAASDVIVADFEGADYGDWKVSGEAFGTGPAHGTLPNQQEVSGFLGKGLVNTFLHGDRSTGTLTSPEFKIERKYVNFLVGGGCNPDALYVALLVDGKIVRKSSGNDNERLDWCTWDVGKLAGSAARIQIVDKATGGWGHINVDHIVLSDRPKAQPPKPEKLYDERYRPQFHFSPTKNWTNDPNGMVYYAGEYHLFFQHNPAGRNWGNMTWGHAVSPDMFHWTQLEHAIYPDKLGTIFSGSAVVDEGNTAGFQSGKEKVLVCIYTSAGGTSAESKGQPFTQSIAYSNDRGRTWTKYAGNPVLKHIVGGNRDPKVFWHAPGKQWIMALYLDGNTYALFSSPDLKQWSKLCDVPLPGGSECPDFFELPVDGDAAKTKWVFWSANNSYLLGTFDGKTFHKEFGPLPTHYGKHRYASQTFSNLSQEDGRRIQIAWMNGAQYPNMPFNQQMSLPVSLTLRTFPEGVRLCTLPVKEVEFLRRGEKFAWQGALKPGENPLASISGELFDIQLAIEPGTAKEVRLAVRGTPIRYDVKAKRLSCLGDLGPARPRPRLPETAGPRRSVDDRDLCRRRAGEHGLWLPAARRQQDLGRLRGRRRSHGAVARRVAVEIGLAQVIRRTDFHRVGTERVHLASGVPWRKANELCQAARDHGSGRDPLGLIARRAQAGWCSRQFRLSRRGPGRPRHMPSAPWATTRWGGRSSIGWTPWGCRDRESLSTGGIPRAPSPCDWTRRASRHIAFMREWLGTSSPRCRRRSLWRNMPTPSALAPWPSAARFHGRRFGPCSTPRPKTACESLTSTCGNGITTWRFLPRGWKPPTS